MKFKKLNEVDVVEEVSELLGIDSNGNVKRISADGIGGGNECTWETIKNNSFVPEVTTYESKVICENVNINTPGGPPRIPVGEDGTASEYLIGGCVYDIVVSDGEHVLNKGSYVYGAIDAYYYTDIVIDDYGNNLALIFTNDTEYNKCIEVGFPDGGIDSDLYLTLTRREYAVETRHNTIDMSCLPFIVFYRETITINENEFDILKCTKTYDECAELVDKRMAFGYVAGSDYDCGPIFGSYKSWDDSLEFYITPYGQYPQKIFRYRRFDGIDTYEYSGE